MGSKIISDKVILEEIKALEDDKKRELLNFIQFLKEKKSVNKKIEWEDIVGIAEFENDASINHDKYLDKAI